MKGANIFLRALDTTDINVMYSWENERNLWQYGSTLTPYSKESIKQWIEKSMKYDLYTLKQLRLMICKLLDNKAVGCVDLFNFNPLHRRAEIGILISEEERNKSFAKETINIIIDYAFNTLNLKQLYCNMTESNKISLKLFSGCGFVICAEKKEWLWINNKWENEITLQLIKNE